MSVAGVFTTRMILTGSTLRPRAYAIDDMNGLRMDAASISVSKYLYGVEPAICSYTERHPTHVDATENGET